MIYKFAIRNSNSQSEIIILLCVYSLFLPCNCPRIDLIQLDAFKDLCIFFKLGLIYGVRNESGFTHYNDNSSLLWCSGDRRPTFFAVVLSLLPELAFANPITEGIDWMRELLTSGNARSPAVIGIAVLGYLAWFGRITGMTYGKYVAAIVLVFGVGTIVDLIIFAMTYGVALFNPP